MQLVFPENLQKRLSARIREWGIDRIGVLDAAQEHLSDLMERPSLGREVRHGDWMRARISELLIERLPIVKRIAFVYAINEVDGEERFCVLDISFPGSSKIR